MSAQAHMRLLAAVTPLACAVFGTALSSCLYFLYRRLRRRSLNVEREEAGLRDLEAVCAAWELRLQGAGERAREGRREKESVRCESWENGSVVRSEREDWWMGVKKSQQKRERRTSALSLSTSSHSARIALAAVCTGRGFLSKGRWRVFAM